MPLESEDGTVQDFPLRSEFLGAGGLEITEVSEGGSVPQVLARNRSPSDLLLLEGEEIVGARQGTAS